jgi:hypothetical protein
MKSTEEIKLKIQELRKSRDSAGCQSAYAEKTHKLEALLWVMDARGELK